MSVLYSEKVMELFASMDTMGKAHNNHHHGNGNSNNNINGNMDRHDDRSSRNSNSSGGGSSERIRMLDITRDKPIKVAVRVAVPVRDHPKFNFVGKLLGPKGNSMKRLQEDTMCKMAVLGRGSMKDRKKEDELRMSGDPRYSHLLEDLHVEISTFAAPAEAHARIAYALAEVRRFLVPDYHDDIRQEQMWEMQALSSNTSTHNQSQEISTASTNSSSTTDLHTGLPPGSSNNNNCNNNSSSSNMLTNGNGGGSILNNINAAAFIESSSPDLNNGQMSQAVAVVTNTSPSSAGPCTASASQQSPGSASASPSSSSTCSSSSCTSSSSQTSGISVSSSQLQQQQQQQHSMMNGNHMETVTTVNGAVVMQHHHQLGHNPHPQMPGHLQGVHNLIGNGNGHLTMQPRHHHSQQQQQHQQHHHSQANGNTILSMAANLIASDLTSAPPPVMEASHHATVLVDPNNSLIHPALRGVKTVNIAGGMARKRPLLGVPRSTMNPTKRTVMTLLARAKNAQQMHSNRHAVESQPFHMLTSPLILQQAAALDVLTGAATHNGATQSVPVAVSAATKENILQSV